MVDGAGFGGEGDAAEGGVVGAVAGAFFAVADEEDGEIAFLGELREGVEERADFVVFVGIDAGDEVADGVDDEEFDVARAFWFDRGRG